MEKYLSAASILTSSNKFHISLGLDRISKIMELLDNPQDNLKCVHIAGTNGKGSVCAFLNNIFIENGLKTGLFTSPHLFSYNERICVNNEKINDKDFDKLVFEISDMAEKNNIPLTEFEILTAVSFLYFKMQNVDIVILETGLGGRLDSTNIIKNPVACAITTIDFDHKERLGNTIEEIATEKAGIIKGDVPVIIQKDNLGFSTIEKYAKNLYVAKNLVEPMEIGLLGNHQKKNLALALETIKHMPFDFGKEKVLKAIKNTRWRFRLEYDKKNKILIDGCHNPNGARALRNFLDENFKNEKLQFVFGCLKNKEYEKMLEILIKKGDELHFVEFLHTNSLKFTDLPEKFKKIAKKYDEKNLDKNALKIYCGSLYMLGEFFKKDDK